MPGVRRPQPPSGTLVDQARAVAATLLEADSADITLDTASGAFHVVGTPAVSAGWSAVAEHLASTNGEAGPRLLHAEDVFDSEAPTFPFGTHVAVVEVDRHTGAAELPFFDRVVLETPTHINPLGAKGIGESGTVGATPAVQNAVIDAVAHLGIRHIDMPLTPQRVWQAITEATADTVDGGYASAAESYMNREGIPVGREATSPDESGRRYPGRSELHDR
ncbi:molybdopterin cofactor-binding domain-containing protein [Candidatus Poriferisodalis sp.]|uniref:molybdopterin cofactor-binding domain-containing protein n=1 Tax=Candidatus Poriferisodalis sp. TaxID=3101277 RepID=UPI003AF4198A